MMAQLGGTGGGTGSGGPVDNPYGPGGDPALVRAARQGEASHA